ncbi:hypothetical protein J4410_01885 [Candidatus Woesearchaeota archaeon]|nr:hypothetical protein [Candidatus Woesearchaeota archaeon]
MKQETKNTFLQIIAYLALALVLVAVLIGFQQTEYKKAEFELLNAEVDAFTAQIEEEIPQLKEARENTQEKVDEGA